VLVAIGPVDADAARRWTAHMLANLEVVRAQRDLLPIRLPDEVVEDFTVLLHDWHAQAVRSDLFHWTADLDPAAVRSLVRYWANLDSLSDEQVRRLGISWAPPSGRPFFEAVAAGVAEALAAEDVDGRSDPFADLLVEHGRRPVRDVGTLQRC
jgi:hypothetical protein